MPKRERVKEVIKRAGKDVAKFEAPPTSGDPFIDMIERARATNVDVGEAGTPVEPGPPSNAGWPRICATPQWR
jgi:hypothetical protein